MNYVLWNVFSCLTKSLLGPLSHIFITYILNLACGLKYLPLIDRPLRYSLTISLRHGHFFNPWINIVVENENERNESWWNCIWLAAVCVTGLLFGKMVLWVQDRGSGDGSHKVRDDEDGHLVYQAGDILQARCTWHFVMFSLRIYFLDIVSWVFFSVWK